MGYIVKIQPGRYFLYVENDQTILDAALKQGFDFPYSCENGICGSCRGRLIQGEIDYRGVEILGLEEDEEAAGYILFCSAVPKTDLVIQPCALKLPWELPVKKLNYKVTRSTSLSPSVEQLILAPAENEAINYFAGQYVLIHHQGTTRAFTIANIPSPDKTIELHIKHSPDNAFTTGLMTDLKNNNTLMLEGPFGQCVYHYLPDKPLLFIAGGTGFSQSKALIEHIINLSFNIPMHLFWVAKTAEDLYFQALAEDWAKNLPHFTFTPIISSPDEGLEGCTDRIQHAVIRAYPDLSRHQIYASGPKEMVLHALAEFEKHGFCADFLFSDIFEIT